MSLDKAVAAAKRPMAPKTKPSKDLNLMKAEMARVMHEKLMRLNEAILDLELEKLDEGEKVDTNLVMRLNQAYGNLVPKHTQNENLNIHAEAELPDKQLLEELAMLGEQRRQMLLEVEQASAARQLHIGDINDAEFEVIQKQESPGARPRTQEELEQRDE